MCSKLNVSITPASGRDCVRVTKRMLISQNFAKLSASRVPSFRHVTEIAFRIHQTSILVSIYVPKLGIALGFILVPAMGYPNL